MSVQYSAFLEHAVNIPTSGDHDIDLDWYMWVRTAASMKDCKSCELHFVFLSPVHDSSPLIVSCLNHTHQSRLGDERLKLISFKNMF